MVVVLVVTERLVITIFSGRTDNLLATVLTNTFSSNTAGSTFKVTLTKENGVIAGQRANE